MDPPVTAQVRMRLPAVGAYREVQSRRTWMAVEEEADFYRGEIG
ncbi:hypothetical protein FMGBMHLM_0884 [Methylobacterium aerolatum]|nr:hypothetical protein FMGBMHLM_0884 [Methylobacterium aerolatum]